VKVRFTPSARTQFLSALDYIRRDNPSAALQFRRRAEAVLHRLEQFPASGRPIPELPTFHTGGRDFAYRFFYRLKEGVVWVVAVFHGARSRKSRMVTCLTIFKVDNGFRTHRPCSGNTSGLSRPWVAVGDMGDVFLTFACLFLVHAKWPPMEIELMISGPSLCSGLSWPATRSGGAGTARCS